MRRTLLAISAVLLATIGTTLLYVYVSTADNRAKAGVERVKVLVVTQDAEPGSAPGALRTEARDVATFDLVPGALTSLTAVQGKVLTTKVFRGQQLLAGMFGESATGGLTPGNRAVSLSFGEAQRVASLIKARSKVAVYQLANGRAKLVLPSATVLSVQPNGIVTFDLNQSDAETLLAAVSAGGLTLSILSD